MESVGAILTAPPANVWNAIAALKNPGELEKIEEDASQETVEDSAQEKTINLGE